MYLLDCKVNLFRLLSNVYLEIARLKKGEAFCSSPFFSSILALNLGVALRWA